MLTDTAKALFEFLKLTPRYLVAVFTVAGIMLFCPQDWLEFVGVLELAKDYRPALGLAFIATGVLLVVALVSTIVAMLKRAARQWQAYRRITQRLNRLTEGEKEILRFYVAHQSRVNTLRINDGVVQGLVASGIIYRSTFLGSPAGGWEYSISEFVWEYLHKQPGVLKGTSALVRTDRRPGL